jgi:hypothetical protein
MAYDFNGTNQALTTAVQSPVTGPPLTISCWFNSDNNAGGNGAIPIYIGNPATLNRYLLALYNSKIQAQVVQSNNANAPATSTSSFATGTWTHAGAVYSTTSSRSVYFNGVNEATNTTSIVPSSITRIQIGRQQFNNISGVSWLNGRLAEVGIWNAALTAEEVASLAKGMTCDKVRPQSLVFYAPLVRDLIDQKGGLTITNNNGATVANHPRVYA